LLRNPFGVFANSITMSPPSNPQRDSQHGWLTSLAFWLCLFTAAALYATVTLSPKLLAYLTLNRDYHANQWQLVSVKKQVDHLQKVIDAQKNDPAFVREQARSDFDVASPDEQRIPVDSHLRLNIGTGSADLVVVPPDLPWYAGLLAGVARSRPAANALLGLAAFLVLYSFTLLYERRSSTDPSTGLT
jgi:cell division protein FtsB